MFKQFFEYLGRVAQIVFKETSELNKSLMDPRSRGEGILSTKMSEKSEAG